MASMGVAVSAHHPHAPSERYRPMTTARFLSESSTSRLIMTQQFLATSCREDVMTVPNVRRQPDIKHTRTVAALDQKDGEEDIAGGVVDQGVVRIDNSVRTQSRGE